MAAKLIFLCIVIAIGSVNSEIPSVSSTQSSAGSTTSSISSSTVRSSTTGTTSQAPSTSVAPIPNWPGIYYIDNSCNRALCCCLNGRLELTRLSGQKLRFQAGFNGFDCPTQNTTVNGTIDEPTGFDMSVVLLGEKSTITLSQDSTQLSIFDLDDLRCSAHAFRNQSFVSTTTASTTFTTAASTMFTTAASTLSTGTSTTSPAKPNWPGSYDINIQCDRTVCCCLSDRLEMTRQPGNMLRLQSNLVGVNCPPNPAFLGQITEPITFDMNINIVNDPIIVRLSPDSQIVTIINLANPKCSGGAMRSKATATYSNNLWMMMMICFVAAAKSVL